jgi:hypothetical protein
MAKTRSPNYPMTDLGTALGLIQPVYKAEHRNKMSRAVLARHMGHNSLNGRALTRIGAVRAYGLIEGSGDEIRVSEDAVRALMAPANSQEQKMAMARCAFRPSLFQDIRKDFPNTHPSDENLRYGLIKKGYTPNAAGKAALAYLKTMQLVGDAAEAYNPLSQEQGSPVQPAKQEVSGLKPPPGMGHPVDRLEAPSKPGIRQEIITLDEGDVVLTFPANLTPDSFGDLKAHLDLFIRKMQRRAAGVPSHAVRGEKPEKTILGEDDEAAN